MTPLQSYMDRVLLDIFLISVFSQLVSGIILLGVARTIWSPRRIVPTTVLGVVRTATPPGYKPVYPFHADGSPWSEYEWNEYRRNAPTTSMTILRENSAYGKRAQRGD